ncbi:hypothetical protein [Prosthecobacter sp.]|uniref:hypothetical protein n=1 Tax=Prosthecobacter sp. TaxID=1965333 RepID=UPI003784A116
MSKDALLRRYRAVLGLFIVCLILSGLTAFPLLHELRLMGAWLGIEDHAAYAKHDGLKLWIGYVWHGLEVTQEQFPFVAYGTDWLAFGHLTIAVFFIAGPWRDPVGNAWVLKVGLLACAAIFPLALICGEVRGIPLSWRLIDCSFGFFGAMPLLYCLRLVRQMGTGTLQSS